MTPDEQLLQNEAISFARSHKKAIARRADPLRLPNPLLAWDFVKAREAAEGR